MRNIENERLKLLSTLKTLNQERSVIRTAELQNLTQSAVSKQLQKLRDWFDDELFVRTAEGMMPTDKTLRLMPRVDGILEEVNALDNELAFSPGDLEGNFVIETTDEVSQRLLPKLTHYLDQHSPKLRISIRRLATQYSIKELETNQIDLVISVNWHAPEQLFQTRLFSDSFVVAMGKGHPLASKKLTPKNYTEAKHLLVAPLNMDHGYVDQYLHQQGYKREIKLSVPNFSDITSELLSDKFIVTLPSQIAKEKSRSMPIKIKKVPLDLPTFNYYLLWHKRMNNNTKNRWLRGVISEIIGEQNRPTDS